MNDNLKISFQKAFSKIILLDNLKSLIFLVKIHFFQILIFKNTYKKFDKYQNIKKKNINRKYPLKNFKHSSIIFSG